MCLGLRISIFLGRLGGLKRGKQDFFFEKKKQKTFTNSASVFPERLGPGFKSFLVLFFSKKNFFLPYLTSISNQRSAIHNNRLPGHKSAPTAGQKQRRAGNFMRLTRPA